MPTFYGTDAQNYLTAKTSGGRKHFRMAHDVMIWKDSYTTVGTEIAGDIIYLAREIPAGAIVIPIFTRIHTRTQPAATAFTANVGIVAAADILAATSINAVGIVTPILPEIELTTAAQPYVTLTTVTGAVTAGRIIDFYFAVRQTS